MHHPPTPKTPNPHPLEGVGVFQGKDKGSPAQPKGYLGQSLPIHNLGRPLYNIT